MTSGQTGPAPSGLAAGRMGGLPVKITGIAFWGMVLVGLLIAVIILHGQEREQKARNIAHAGMLAMMLEQVVEGHPPGYLTENQTTIEQVIDPLKKAFGFEAIEVVADDDILLLGATRPDQHVVESTFPHHLPKLQGGVDTHTARIKVFFPDTWRASAAERKRVLLLTGMMVMLFGLILQRVLHYIISRPFLDMVSTAKRFGEGDTTQRFSESAGDEFGFLARFINQALDAMLAQQSALQDALNRIKQSEAALFDEKERVEVTLHSIADGVIATDAQGRVEYMNPVAAHLTGWSREDARHHEIREVLPIFEEASREPLANPVEVALASGSPHRLPEGSAFLISCKSEEEIAIEGAAELMRNARGEIIGAVLAFQDVRRTRELTRQLSRQATHDGLTGLYNRRKFENRLRQLAREERDEQESHVVFYMDLDQFKIVNDTCGHMAGDELLRRVAPILHGCLRKGDMLARLGGDEFGVLLEYCDLEMAERVATKLQQAVREFRFPWGDKLFEIGVSIGIVLMSPEDNDVGAILSAADMACYAAKEAGRGRVRVYRQADEALVQRHGEMQWISRLTQALEQDMFVLYCQPIIPLSEVERDIRHWEVLVRLRNQDGGIVPPGAFIAAAERYSLMTRIDRWVIRHSFLMMADAAPGGKRLAAINLSGASLGDEGLLEYIRRMRQETGVTLEDICFEITETAAIRNLSAATHFISELKSLGCRFALDDFGSGLSSFAYLKNLPVDYLKIDGGFVRDVAANPVARAMVEAVNTIGHTMGLKTVAEWVEDEATLDVLRDIGVDFAQGYHTGRPRVMTENCG